MDKLKKLLTNENKSRIVIVTAAIAALMLINTIYQLGMHLRWQYWLSQVRAAESSTTQPASTQPTDTQPATKDKKKVREKKKKDKPLQISADIKKRDIFTKPKPKGHGMKLTGVLGNAAMFSDRGGQTVCIEEGKASQEVKVVKIDNYNVTIEYKGKTETMKLFTDKGFSDQSPIATVDTPKSKPTESEPKGMGSKPAEAIKMPEVRKRGGRPVRMRAIRSNGEIKIIQE